MQKIYIARLSNDERQMCLDVVKKLKGTSMKVRRANILLKTDVDGPNWKDQDIADVFFCTRQCVENLHKRLVTEGFEVALNDKKRERPPRQKILDGEQEAKIIALRFSDSPKGSNDWTLRLLAEKVVEFEIAPQISHVTVGKTLKKQNNKTQSPILGYPAETGWRIRHKNSGCAGNIRTSTPFGHPCLYDGRIAGVTFSGSANADFGKRVECVDSTMRLWSTV